MKITLAKGGRAEKTVDLKDVQIPDLWKVAHLKELEGYTLGGKPLREIILENWHLSHDLLDTLREIEKGGFIPPN